MRTLKLQVQTTLDGYMGGPNGELSWMTWAFSDDMKEYMAPLQEFDSILLGKNLAEGFIPHWEQQPKSEPQEFIDKVNDASKFVFSNTLTESPWKNTEIISGDLAEEVRRLKNQPGGAIIVYGGSTLVTALLAENLVDDVHMFTHPAAIGSGLPVFPDTGTVQRFDCISAQGFECGVTALHLQPKL